MTLRKTLKATAAGIGILAGACVLGALCALSFAAGFLVGMQGIIWTIN